MDAVTEIAPTDERRMIMDNCRQACPYNTLGGCKVKEYNAKPQTNADRIRAMSDDELAQEMIFFCPTDTVFNGNETYEKPHYTGLDGRYYPTSEELVSANLEWLQQPAE